MMKRIIITLAFALSMPHTFAMQQQQQKQQQKQKQKTHNHAHEEPKADTTEHAGENTEQNTQTAQDTAVKAHTCILVHAPCTHCGCRGCLNPCDHCPETWVCVICNTPRARKARDEAHNILYGMQPEEREAAWKQIDIHRQTNWLLRSNPQLSYEEARRQAEANYGR